MMTQNGPSPRGTNRVPPSCRLAQHQEESR